MNDFHPVPKPKYNRRVKKQNRFPAAVIKEILERDGYQCVRCGNYHVESIPHHVLFRSHGGKGIKRNGVTICRDCHNWAHESKKNNEWFKAWVDLNLDNRGGLIHDVPLNPGIF